MSSDRPYRRAYNFDEMMSEVRRCSGSQFDPGVVRAFEKLAEKKGPTLINTAIHIAAVASPANSTEEPKLSTSMDHSNI
jgi:HD-GYP domain-containing protein (c-di-GMP phosphodiesterase class II)